MAEKKKNGLKTVLAFVGLGMLAVGAIVGLKTYNKTNEPDTPPVVVTNPNNQNQQGVVKQQDIKLAKPENVEYDEKDGVLSWDSVDHANGYTVTIDGWKYKTNTNSYIFEVPAEANDGEKIVFEVGANASEGYTASEKTTLEHTITMQQAKLKQDIFNNLKSGFEHGMKINYMRDTITRIDHVTYTNHNLFIYGSNPETGKFASITFDLTDLCDFETADTLEQLRTASSCLTQVEEKNILEFGSSTREADATILDMMLSAPRNSSLLSTLYKDGYTITRLSTSEYRMGDSSMNMSGVYKCQKGDDVQIISTMNQCFVESYAEDFGVSFEDAVASPKAYARFRESSTIVFSKAGMEYQNYLDSIEQNLNM